MPAAPRRLFIIDTMALFFRSFYALGRSSLATSQGQPTGAIYGTAMFMNKLLTEQRPDFLVAACDTPEPTFRQAMYPAYKAHRDEMPSDLAAQLPQCLELMTLYRCPLLRLAGVEADDLIGTLVRRFAGPELDIYIISGDKDFMQLIGDHAFMLAPKKDEEALLIDRAAVHEKFLCTPEQVIDALALIGDAADNVPGVHGIGEKGAAKLIAAYGSLEGIYENLAALSPKLRASLEAGRSDAFMSRQLVTLKTNLELSLTLDQMTCDWRQAVANNELLAMFNRLQFRTLAQKVQSALLPPDLGTAAAIGSSSPEVAARPAAAASMEVSETIDWSLVARMQECVAACSYFAFTIFSSGMDVIEDRALSLALVTDAGATFQLPLTQEGVYILRPLLTKGVQMKVTHGLKHSLHMLGNVGINLGIGCIDIEICDYLIDPNHYDHSLQSMLARWEQQESPILGGVAQAEAIIALYRKLAPRLAATGLERVLNEVEMPLVPVLARMERCGFYIDAEFLDTYSNELAKTATGIAAELYAAAGGEFNINSPKQLQALLFDRLKLHEVAGLKRLKRTKTGYSTDESVLQQLAEAHPIPKLIVAYREVSKLKNTYVDPLPQFINPRSNRVHTTFRQTVAATGRLSSDKPNLQNIPIQSTLGRRIRQAFKPLDSGSLLISADYSQVELRLLAHLADAKDMITAFIAGLDVHTVTAAKIFGVAESAVTPQLRSRAKAVNFGIIYGMGPQRLAATTGVSLSEAKAFIQRYFEVYPAIKTYTQSLIAAARTTGYCVTMLGRRRPIPELGDKNEANRARGENIAVNAPIQGSAADLIKIAMIRIDHALNQQRLKTRMLLQVHDELVFSAPHSEVPHVISMIRVHMEHALVTKVPLKVDIRTGPDWLAAH